MASPGVYIWITRRVLLAHQPLVAIERLRAGLHLKKLVTSYCDGAPAAATPVSFMLGLGVEGFELTRPVDKQGLVPLYDGTSYTFGRAYTDWAWGRTGRKCQVKNIEASDATVVIAPAETKAVRELYELSAQHNKPMITLTSFDDAASDRLYEWACAHRFQSLNIAGNREGEVEYIEDGTFIVYATQVLMRSFAHRTNMVSVYPPLP